MRMRFSHTTLLLLALAISASAQTTFTYQGRLTQNGAIIQGPTTRTLTFQLCNALAGGTPLSSTTLDVEVIDSLFTAELNFPNTLFDGSQRWLQIRIGDTNGPALTPRQKITAVPYAFYSLRAAPGSTLAAPDGAPNPALAVDADGKVGIGTSTPAAQLTIDGTGTTASGLSVISPGGSTGSIEFGSPGGDPGLVGIAVNGHRRDIRFDEASMQLLVSPDATIPGQSSGITIANTGDVGIGSSSPDERLEIVDSLVGGLTFPLKLENSGLNTNGTSVGMLFQVDGGGDRGKGALAYERLSSWNRGSFHFLQNDLGDASLPTLADAVLTITNAGNVGIGTTAPAQRLSVAGTIQSTTGGFLFPDGSLQTSAATPGGGHWTGSGNDIHNNNSGNVGIGTGAVAPAAVLHVKQSVGGTSTPCLLLDNQRTDGAPRLTFSNNANSAWIHLTPDAADDQFEIKTFNSDVVIDSSTREVRFQTGSERRFVFDPGLSAGTGKFEIYDTNETLAFRLGADNANNAGRLSMFASNGTTATIDLIADEGDGASQVEMRNGAATTTVLIDAAEGSTTGGAGLKLYNGSGNRTIDLDADVGSTHEGYIAVTDPADSRRAIILDSNNNGSAWVTTQVLEITGGSDFSEQFDISDAAGESPQPGMVVVIDDAKPGELRIASEPHDRKVAGVISGAGGVQPGLLMGQKGSAADGRYPVALTGRVFVLVDADLAPIKPGDFLTTSSTRGYAMKAADREAAAGAILGKAMTSLESGRGLVLVLVNLQ